MFDAAEKNAKYKELLAKDDTELILLRFLV